MDAEALEFRNEEFDFVWSWGVIHHSESTARALSEIARVLKPASEAGLMVYSLDGMPAYITMMRSYALAFWQGGDLDQLLWRASDGYTARYYSRDSWREAVLPYFDVEMMRLCGQDADVVPVPRQIRPMLLKLLSSERQVALAGRRGSMLFSRVKKRAS